ncbi:hypothetical protein BC834DRAFT_976125 [Gloeopeniophorella convolvens]|nr:hypothetical protein BC834DRAFT_976125 [Gloeopeniophorella convolvens]
MAQVYTKCLFCAKYDVRFHLMQEVHAHEKELFTKIPLGWPWALKTPIDWNFESTPQTKGGDPKVTIPCGKVVGGTSSINALISAAFLKVRLIRDVFSEP